jgi:hypothetical protein
MEFSASFADEAILGHAQDRPAEAEPRCGYGACSQCSCQGFMGSGDLCDNCHHNYSFHG